MSKSAVIDQVAGILTRADVPFQMSADGDEYRVLRGSTAVFIRVADWGEGTVVHFWAPVAGGIDLKDADNFGGLHIVANDLNREQYFLKWVVSSDDENDGSISIEYDLLGDELDAHELLNALGEVSGAADHFDDEIIDQFGGKRFEDYVREAEDEGPVVET